MSNRPSRPTSYTASTRFCEKGHDTHIVGRDYEGSCSLCRTNPSRKQMEEASRTEQLLKLTSELEHCMSWERRDILMKIRDLKRGSMD